MEQAPVGRLIAGAAEKDAIHIAILPVTAAHELNPKQDIGFLNDDGDLVAANVRHWIGIVDPFLKYPVPKGGRFWLWMYPNTITSLRHAWTHPAVEGRSL